MDSFPLAEQAGLMPCTSFVLMDDGQLTHRQNRQFRHERVQSDTVLDTRPEVAAEFVATAWLSTLDKTRGFG